MPGGKFCRRRRRKRDKLCKWQQRELAANERVSRVWWVETIGKKGEASGVVFWRIEAHSRGLASVDSVLRDGRDYEAYLNA